MTRVGTGSRERGPASAAQSDPPAALHHQFTANGANCKQRRTSWHCAAGRAISAQHSPAGEAGQAETAAAGQSKREPSRARPHHWYSDTLARPSLHLIAENARLEMYKNAITYGMQQDQHRWRSRAEQHPGMSSRCGSWRQCWMPVWWDPTQPASSPWTSTTRPRNPHKPCRACGELFSWAGTALLSHVP